VLFCAVVLATVGAMTATPAKAATIVFSDGFESGGLAGYHQVTHSGVQQSVVHTGAWAWRATNPNGQPSYAYHSVASSSDIRVTAWVNVISRASSVKLFAVRGGRGRSLDVYVDQRSRVSVRNNIGAVTTYGGTTVGTGGWHQYTLHATVGDGTGTIAVSLDGAPVPGLTLTGQKLGTIPFDEVRLGDLATAAVFDVAIDDIAVSTP
jgi:hypothetical protein